MGVQRIQGSGNVQIQNVADANIQVVYNEVPRTVPLEPALVPVGTDTASPARLVRAHAGMVPYVDRGGLLADLSGWIDSETAFSGLVIGGRGGAGKTRLAVKACEEVRCDRWLSGFLARTADSGELNALVHTPIPRLVVIDYAESRAEQVERLLPLLREYATTDTPVRVLMLVRTASGQTGTWPGRLGNRVDALDALLDECEVRLLEDDPFTPEDRDTLFVVAVEAFREQLGLEAPTGPVPDLGETAFESPLMVVIAAYLAAHGEESPSSRDDLLEEVLHHECRYWNESAAGLDADEELLQRLVAVATLVSVDDEEMAAEAVRLVPDLRDATMERRARLGRWVRAQYPGPRWWNPLEPDLVGEYLVAQCFAGKPEILGGLLGTADPEGIIRPLQVLARAGGDHVRFANTAGSAVSGELERLCALAVRQARAVRDRDLLYGTTVAAALNAAASSLPLDPAVMQAAVRLMPPRPDVVLGELAATLAAKDLELRARPSAESDPAKATEHADALNDLSNRLSDMGHHEEALAAIEQCVGIHRSLAETDEIANGLAMAMALNNFSNCLSEVGRHEEALAAIEESVGIRRGLATANPEMFLPFLAGGLHNLPGRLSAVGRRDEALAAMEECVELFRPLAAADPTAFEVDFAGVLNNLSGNLAAAHRPKEALAAIEQSVEIYRPLAAANPAAHQLALATALNNLSTSLREVERHEEALTASEQSVAIRRPLAAANPAAYERGLAGALTNHSSCLAEVGRHEEALTAVEQSVAISRPLAEANPVAAGPDLALALTNLSNRLNDVGRVDEAVATNEEGVRMYRELAATNPAYGRYLFIALRNVANLLDSVGREEHAQAARQEAMGYAPPQGDQEVG